MIPKKFKRYLPLLQCPQIWKEQVLYKGERTALRLFLESGAQSAGTGPPGWAQNLGRAAKLFLALYIGVPTRLDYHLVLGPLLGEWPTLGCNPRQTPKIITPWKLRAGDQKWRRENHGFNITSKFLGKLIPHTRIPNNCQYRSLLTPSLAVLGMWSCTVKIDEENWTYAGLTEEKRFGSA
jgi:hypothetical protein